MPTSTSTVEVQAKPEQVWSVIADGPRMPEWLTPVKALEER
ncbi:MAG: SRPBCC family protein, partial [Dehalococcoidia bacterium]